MIASETPYDLEGVHVGKEPGFVEETLVWNSYVAEVSTNTATSIEMHTVHVKMRQAH